MHARDQIQRLFDNPEFCSLRGTERDYADLRSFWGSKEAKRVDDATGHKLFQVNSGAYELGFDFAQVCSSPRTWACLVCKRTQACVLRLPLVAATLALPPTAATRALSPRLPLVAATRGCHACAAYECILFSLANHCARVQPFALSNHSTGMLFMRPLDIPDRDRGRREFTFPVAFIPGPKEPTNIDVYIAPIALEFKQYGPNGAIESSMREDV